MRRLKMNEAEHSIIINPSAAWMPAGLLSGTGPGVYRVSFTPGERRVFRRKRKIPVSVWAERHRMVTMSALPGPWHNEITPYLTGIMDASFHPGVQTVIVCKAPQVGCTEALLNCIGYAVDRDPGPVLMVYPDEKTARENSQDRIQPMITASPGLRTALTGADDDEGTLRIKLKHMIIYMAWATSAARLANKPIRYLVLDELDKYPLTAGKKEASPEALAEIRTQTYRWNRRIWKISTPTIETGPVWQALTTEAQVIFDYLVRCPLCGKMELMTFGNIKWPRDGESGGSRSADPEAILAGHLAWYECGQCGGRWSDSMRDSAVRAGEWRKRSVPPSAGLEERPALRDLREEERPDGLEDAEEGGGMELFEYLDRHRPGKIGFHLPSWISYFVSLSEVASDFLKSLHTLEAFKNFKNKHEAVPWKQVVISTSEEGVLAARCQVPPQTVPPEGVALTAGIDVQKFGFWFTVRAWASDLTSWNIHHGFLATWDDVEKLLYETTYPVEGSGRRARIRRAAVDTGGGKKYENMTMTEETYFWILKNRGRGGLALWGTKGASNPLPGMLNLGGAITSTPGGRKLSGGLRILMIDTHKAKDQFHYRLGLAAEGLSGGAYLHSGTGRDYAAQILAEEKQINERGQEEWVNPHQRDNHFLDTECLAAACVEMEFPGGGIRLVAEALRRRGGNAGQRQGRRVISGGVEV